MTKELRAYRAHIENLLSMPAPGIDWDVVKQEHVVHIGFFQHERLIHLMVTLAFAVMAVISLGLALALNEPLLLIMLGLFLALLVPYIAHYYALENGVQGLCRQYDRLDARQKGGA